MSDSDPNISTSAGGSTTGIAVGVSLGCVFLVISGIAFYFWRRRRQAKGSTRTINDSRRHTTAAAVDPNHLAARVTPFFPGQEVPRFTHRPGENMRVARRRSDGGWDFSEPLAITPPSAPFAESLHPAQSSPSNSIFKKEKVPGELTTRGYVETDSEGLPPPAYSTSESGHSSMYGFRFGLCG
ncbi:unnamed protein product [Somion occarium]|uniref:Uncharacterized protein n=1 Tax=Somion occarium TaxID=3059160 RepID=A0ABP1DVZ5_9APHY